MTNLVYGTLKPFKNFLVIFRLEDAKKENIEKIFLSYKMAEGTDFSGYRSPEIKRNATNMWE